MVFTPPDRRSRIHGHYAAVVKWQDELKAQMRRKCGRLLIGYGVCIGRDYTRDCLTPLCFRHGQPLIGPLFRFFFGNKAGYTPPTFNVTPGLSSVAIPERSFLAGLPEIRGWKDTNRYRPVGFYTNGNMDTRASYN